MAAIQIPIRELHARTGHFVRLAARKGEIIVTEHGKPTARLSPITPASTETAPSTLAERRQAGADYRAALAGGNLTSSDDSTATLPETAALRDL